MKYTVKRAYNDLKELSTFKAEYKRLAKKEDVDREIGLDIDLADKRAELGNLVFEKNVSGSNFENAVLAFVVRRYHAFHKKTGIGEIALVPRKRKAYPVYL